MFSTSGLLARGLVAGLALALVGGCKPRRDEPTGPSPSVAAATDVQRVEIKALSRGFEPAEVHFKSGRPAVLAFTRVEDVECVNAVQMPWMDRPVDLPLGKTVEITIPDTSRPGSFTYACWMNMVFGRVVIDPG